MEITISTCSFTLSFIPKTLTVHYESDERELLVCVRDLLRVKKR